MLPSVARAAAKSLLRQAGLDTLAESNHARRRAEKAALALERALSMKEQLAGQTAWIEQEYQQRIRELERRIAESQDASDGDRQHPIAELQRQHARELAAAEERFEQRLNEVKAHYRDRLAAVVQDTTNARQELMMVEVKLDILEASINVLDRRTRVIGVLPSAVRPVRRQSSAPEVTPSQRLTAGIAENGATSPSEAHEPDADDTRPGVSVPRP